MKKIMFMLLGVAAALNAMAVDYTAKAKLTLTAESGYTCNLMLSQADEFGALNGSEMNMEDRKVALYALNGATKLQIAKASDLEGVNVGVILTDADTKYTITVSSVEGTETLYLNDGTQEYALTNGASYDFSATTLAFTLSHKATPATPAICHQNGHLEITAYQGASVKVLAYADESEVIAATDITEAYKEIDLKDLAAGQYIVVLTTTDGDQRLVIKK